MFVRTVFLALIPALALAAPATDLSARKDDLQTCCFTTDNGNKPIFITDGDGSFLDTLSWCFLDVQRDASDPNNCAKAEAHISSGYCSTSEVAEVIQCPASQSDRERSLVR